jgi:hypothetical protein
MESRSDGGRGNAVFPPVCHSIAPFPLGRKSVRKQGNPEAEVHEYVEHCSRTLRHNGERAQFEPGIRVWTPSNDLA